MHVFGLTEHVTAYQCGPVDLNAFLAGCVSDVQMQEITGHASAWFRRHFYRTRRAEGQCGLRVTDTLSQRMLRTPQHVSGVGMWSVQAARRVLALPLAQARGVRARACSGGARGSNRGRDVPSFVVMDVMSAAASRERVLEQSGRVSAADRVLHLEVGQPASGAPRAVVQAAIRALEDSMSSSSMNVYDHTEKKPDPLGYTVALGELKLRQRIAELYTTRYGINVHEDEVAVTTGSSGAFMAVFSALWDAGDNVICPLPGYPCYRNVLSTLGVNVVPINTDLNTRFTPTTTQLDNAHANIDGDIKGLIVASPGNPTGCSLSYQQLNDLTTYCHQYNMHMICDEIYHGISLHTDPVKNTTPSALEVSNDVIIVSSFSKYWSMSGWRLGFIICRNRSIMQALNRLLQNMHISAPTISQRAAIAAFDCDDELAQHVARYRENARILVDALPPLGFECYMPDGAFYVYTRASAVMHRLGLQSSVDLCKLMLEETGIAATPGVDFDPVRGTQYVRFSVSGSTEDVSDACDRLHVWLAGDARVAGA